MPQVIRPDGLYQSQQRFGLYRWHVLDPIHFASDLRVEIQALGWQSGRRYRPLHDDVPRRRCSTSTNPAPGDPPSRTSTRCRPVDRWLFT